MEITDYGGLRAGIEAPKGFEVYSCGRGRYLIRYKQPRFWAAIPFVLMILSVWSTFCWIMILDVFYGDTSIFGEPVSPWFASLFWVAELILICFFTYHLFGGWSLRLGEEQIKVTFSLFGLRRNKMIVRGQVSLILQKAVNTGDNDRCSRWPLYSGWTPKKESLCRGRQRRQGLVRTLSRTRLG